MLIPVLHAVVRKKHEDMKAVAILSNPFRDWVYMAMSLFGILPADMTLEEAREKRLGQI